MRIHFFIALAHWYVKSAVDDCREFDEIPKIKCERILRQHSENGFKRKREKNTQTERHHVKFIDRRIPFRVRI